MSNSSRHAKAIARSAAALAIELELFYPGWHCVFLGRDMEHYELLCRLIIQQCGMDLTTSLLYASRSNILQQSFESEMTSLIPENSDIIFVDSGFYGGVLESCIDVAQKHTPKKVRGCLLASDRAGVLSCFAALSVIAEGLPTSGRWEVRRAVEDAIEQVPHSDRSVHEEGPRTVHVPTHSEEVQRYRAQLAAEVTRHGFLERTLVLRDDWRVALQALGRGGVCDHSISIDCADVARHTPLPYGLAELESEVKRRNHRGTIRWAGVGDASPGWLRTLVERCLNSEASDADNRGASDVARHQLALAPTARRTWLQMQTLRFWERIDTECDVPSHTDSFTAVLRRISTSPEGLGFLVDLSVRSASDDSPMHVSGISAWVLHNSIQQMFQEYDGKTVHERGCRKEL